ncbi:MAG: type II toxin-antitoxin system VapC family toxin [Actinobacteria bacterium]|nr:type II toxin-antitoxin system VapC family toxin [Actinomycetota bacterium]
MTVTVDTSALVAVVLGEPDAERYASVLTRHAGDITVSDVTLVEASIVLIARQGDVARDELDRLVELVGAVAVAVDSTQCHAAVAAWRRFGKGRHQAGLNLGDCFSYALAKTTGTSLLYKGDDFTQTDIAAAL